MTIIGSKTAKRRVAKKHETRSQSAFAPFVAFKAYVKNIERNTKSSLNDKNKNKIVLINENISLFAESYALQQKMQSFR